MGIKVARIIMNHHNGYDVFTKHYSRGVGNLQLVNLRLGEIKGSKESEPGQAIAVSLTSSYISV